MGTHTFTHIRFETLQDDHIESCVKMSALAGAIALSKLSFVYKKSHFHFSRIVCSENIQMSNQYKNLYLRKCTMKNCIAVIQKNVHDNQANEGLLSRQKINNAM